MLSSCNLASECTACHHFLTAFIVASVVAGVGWGGDGVFRVEWTRRFLKFFGHLKVTGGGLEMACFSFLEACSMGRCFLTFCQGSESGMVCGYQRYTTWLLLWAGL